MPTGKLRAAVVLILACVGFSTVGSARQRSQPGAAALSALDYIQIQQLVYKYGWALDSGADNGFAYADLFVPDGVFTGTNQPPNGRSYQGRENLAALARGGRRGPLYVSHYITNVVVEPAAGGAIGRAYVMILDIGEGGKPSTTGLGGRYDDVYVKTAQGWRFKTRTFYASKSGEPVQPPPTTLGPLQTLQRSGAPAAPANAVALTAEDYIEIQQLVSRYPYALDENVDNGASYADLFAPGAVFGRPRTEGRENLAKLATAEPHGPQYVRHFITNHVIEPSPEGAVGKEYLVVIDIGEAGKPSSIFIGGHYDDVYTKTPQGWRFKLRTFTPSRSGATPAQP